MSINLKKGQKIDLRKSNPGLSTIRVGLGWDPVEQGGGFLKALFGSGQADIDCDASVFLLNEDSKPVDLVYFGNLRTKNDSIIHTGDNLTGEGAGDDEVILVDLDKIPSQVNKLLFVVNIYDLSANLINSVEVSDSDLDRLFPKNKISSYYNDGYD